MSEPLYLITGAGGGTGGVSRLVIEQLRARGERVRAMVHRDDDRADPLRELGAEVVVGDLTDPQDVVDAMTGADRMFFSMSVSADYLQATAVVAAAAREYGRLETIVNMSQLTVSQMTLTSRDQSRQHRLHWLAEQVLNWSGLPVVHMQADGVSGQSDLHPACRSAAARAKRVGAAVRSGPDLTDRGQRRGPRRLDRAAGSAAHIGAVYELTGPVSLDVHGLAAEYGRALAPADHRRGHPA